MAPTVGESIPEDLVFSYIPYTDDAEHINACGIPINYNASKEWKDKKVVLFSLPGAFTPTCSAAHVPGYIKALPELKAKGVDVVAVIAYNDAYVMSAWGKAQGVKGDDILFLSDYNAKFATSVGWNHQERTDRFAVIIDKGKYIYAEKEPHLQTLSVSSAEAILKALE